MATNNARAKELANSKSGVIGFFKDLKSEFKRITWAPKKDVKKATVTVLVFCLIYMVIVGAFDYSFNNLMRFVFSLF